MYKQCGCFWRCTLKKIHFTLSVLISNNGNVVFVFFSRYWIKCMHSYDSFYFVYMFITIAVLFSFNNFRKKNTFNYLIGIGNSVLLQHRLNLFLTCQCRFKYKHLTKCSSCVINLHLIKSSLPIVNGTVFHQCYKTGLVLHTAPLTWFWPSWQLRELEFVFILALPVIWSEHLESMQVQFLCSWAVVKVKDKWWVEARRF